MTAETSESVPGWSGFNAVAKAKDVPGESIVGYCQLIDASPTELSTVYTLLKKSVTMANRLGLDDTMVVLDQAIYAKALEVIWKQRQEFNSVVLMMGDFHVACVFLAVIGKRFGDAGIRDLLIEARIIGNGSLNGVLEGKHYNPSLRMHKIVLEALKRLSWQAFIQCSKESQDRSLTQQIETAGATLQNVRKEVTSASIQALYRNPVLKDLLQSIEEFNRSSSGKMSKYCTLKWLLCYCALYEQQEKEIGTYTLHVSKICCRGCLRTTVPITHGIFQFICATCWHWSTTTHLRIRQSRLGTLPSRGVRGMVLGRLLLIKLSIRLLTVTLNPRVAS